MLKIIDFIKTELIKKDFIKNIFYKYWDLETPISEKILMILTDILEDKPYSVCYANSQNIYELNTFLFIVSEPNSATSKSEIYSLKIWGDSYEKIKCYHDFIETILEKKLIELGEF